MKILFICGTLEPGKDGVGDYTYRLATQIIKSGHEVSIIALNDKFSDNIINNSVIYEDVKISILRLPAKLDNKLKYGSASRYLGEFNPEWISLQYVSFAFHPKGLPVGLSGRLKKLGAGKKWHIMFHELWVGMDDSAAVKMKVLGWLQKQIIHNLIKKLKPKLINTHTHLYQYQLLKLKAGVKILPLFGNLPVKPGMSIAKKDEGILNFILFGGLHYGAPIKEFVLELVEWNKTRRLDIQFFFVGNNGSELTYWKSVLSANKFKIQVFGFLTPPEIVSLLIKADIGITTTPEILIEKSGSVASMKECGLPVICIAREWKVKGFNEVMKLSQNLDECTDAVFMDKRIVIANAASNCAKKFIETLN